MRNELVDRPASDEIRELLTEDLAPLVPSRSLAGVQKFPKGSLNSLMSRAGISPGAMHDCAVVDRRPDATKDNVVQYIAIGFGSRKSSEWPSLIQELDRCIQLNNSRTTPEISQEVETDESESEPEVEDELGIIGTDDRMPVRDTLAVPFRWVCRIWIQYRIKFESGRVENRGLAPLGTGVLVTRRHVLTAAHNLHDIIDGKEQFASNVEVAPGANENDRPFGTIEAKSWKIASKWKPGSKFSQWDYALITLKDDVGKKTIKGWNDNGPLCYWGSTSGGAGTSVGAVPPALLGGLIGTRVVTAGYPGSTKGQMICAAGAFSAGVAGRGLNSASLVETWIKTNGVFYITADASKGQSGSPVWILNGGKRYMIGILAAIGERENVVVNLMSTALSEIKGWLRES